MMNKRRLRIVILGAGAGAMMCGSCLRDNALAGALKRMGHDVVLVPLYTPMRVDGHEEAQNEVFYGGVNVYMQNASGLFRHTPRVLDWIFDRRWMLKLAGRYGTNTPVEKLGGLALEILRGEHGTTVKELHRLIGHLQLLKPDVVSLPYLMFIGAAGPIRDALKVPVVCELTGEDIFLEALAEKDRRACQEVIRKAAADVAVFVATSQYYAEKMAGYIGVDLSRIAVVYPGIEESMVAAPGQLTTRAERNRAATVGYFARVCPEKGIGDLVSAMEILRGRPGQEATRLLWGGYLGPKDARWHAELARRAGSWGEFRPDVSREDKVAMLDRMDVMSVPGVYPEPKGLYLLEAWARGVPVVQPRHGSYVELLQAAEGGVLVEPRNAGALADGLAELLGDQDKRTKSGRAGWEVVREKFLDRHMAEGMVSVYERAMESS